MMREWRARPGRVRAAVSRPSGRPWLHVPLESSEVRLVAWCQWLLLALVAGALALAAWWGWESQILKQEAERVEAATARAVGLNQSFAAQMQREGLDRSPNQIGTARVEVAFANQLTEKRSFSWTRLLSDLEETIPPEVSIASIKLNFQESAVVLEGTARRLHDLNRFVHRLQEHRAFREAVLSKHELRRDTTGPGGAAAGDTPVTGDGEAGRFVEYSLTVLYRPTL